MVESHRLLTTSGVVTTHNAAERVEELLNTIAELCAAFPEETKKVNPLAWKQAAIYGKEAVGELLTESVACKLHAKQAHPDYEYEPTFPPLGSRIDAGPPPGNGWVVNPHVSVDFSRGSVYTHWMRTKQDALADDVNLAELPARTLEKYTLAKYLSALRDKLCKGYMPSSSRENGYNSKPEYCDNYKNILDPFEYGVHSMDSGPTREASSASIELFGEDIFFTPSDRGDKEANMLFVFADDQLKIITVLRTDKTFVTVKRADGQYQRWQEWTQDLSIPVNTHALEKVLDCV